MKPKKDAESDLINKAPHYNHSGGIECIEAIKAALGKDGFVAWLRGTILKYLWRGPHKGTPGLDAAKLSYYAKRLEEELKADD